jgi:hypothetical protein
MERNILLSEVVAVSDILKSVNIQIPEDVFISKTITENYRETNHVLWRFNQDIFISFANESDVKSSQDIIGGMLETLPFTAFGTLVFVRIKQSDHTLCTLEQMFGESLPINCYRRYIQSFNKKLMEIKNKYNLPLFPIQKNKNKQSYFRYWVFKENMTALYYPNDSLPRYDCETEELYRSDDCGVNLLLDKDNLVAIDGWMSIPDELKHISDMKLVVA